MRARTLSVLLLSFAYIAGQPPDSIAQTTQELRRMTIEELMSIEVTTASRTPQAGALTPAAVFVITQDDIRRSGATTIPDVLRLAPGVQVARIDSSKWAIGMRGFPDRLARAMLVLIDGRAVYSPLFAGTYWEVQDTLIDDIERIEVIRGPGGTLWGSNAVNGIINIITKGASDTQGLLFKAGGGSEEHGFGGLRYGGSRGESFHYRGYVKLFDRDALHHANGDEFDDWNMGQGGFRGDWSLSGNREITVQGDVYKGNAGQRSTLTTYTPPFSQFVERDADLSGGNVLARWTAPWGRSAIRFQTFYDRTNRTEPTFTEHRDTVDFDFQHTLGRFSRHQLVWGLGYRISRSDTRGVETLRFVPPDRTDSIYNVFAQDQITLQPDRWILTVGSKFEHNGYSGFDAQPSARLVWTPTPAQAVVASVAHAVRTPSRVERDLELTTLLAPAGPVFLRLEPNPDFEPEQLTAYETSYRRRIGPRVFVTASAFFNHYQDVLGTEVGTPSVEPVPPPAHVVLPLVFANGLHGNSHGVEVNSDVRITGWSRWTASYSFLRVQLTRDADSRDASQERRGEGLSPRHQAQTQWSMDLPGGFGVDWLFRFVGDLPAIAVPSYTTSDVRVAYRPSQRLELALVGKDLHEPHHVEFTGGTLGGDAELQRSVYAKVTIQW